jgi:hypothetical protein
VRAGLRPVPASTGKLLGQDQGDELKCDGMDRRAFAVDASERVTSVDSVLECVACVRPPCGRCAPSELRCRQRHGRPLPSCHASNRAQVCARRFVVARDQCARRRLQESDGAVNWIERHHQTDRRLETKACSTHAAPGARSSLGARCVCCLAGSIFNPGIRGCPSENVFCRRRDAGPFDAPPVRRTRAASTARRRASRKAALSRRSALTLAQRPSLSAPPAHSPRAPVNCHLGWAAERGVSGRGSE